MIRYIVLSRQNVLILHGRYLLLSQKYLIDFTYIGIAKSN